jgi:hypothetical protein
VKGDTTHARTLQRAARLLGGKERLREHLRIPMRALDTWLAGAEKPPMDIFLKAVDVISSGTSTPAAFLQLKFAPGERRAMLEAALESAITATGAEMGNVQLAEPEGLRIVAQRGFGQAFLDFYAVVDDGSAASCGVAKKTLRRIVVPDVASSEIFAGTPAEGIMAGAGVRSVQSTPLVGPSGTLYGMLNTHWASPRDLSKRDAEALDQIATRAAFWLNGSAI